MKTDGPLARRCGGYLRQGNGRWPGDVVDAFGKEMGLWRGDVVGVPSARYGPLALK